MKSSRAANGCAVISLLILTVSAAVGERKELGTMNMQRSDAVHWPTVMKQQTYVIYTLLAKVTSLENSLKTIVYSDIDECRSSPCQNGGSCQDQVNAYTCACVPGYTGDYCQTDIDECSSSPCQNRGSCQDQVNAYTCNCAAGYTGDHCQTEIHAVLNDGSLLLFRVTPGIGRSAYDRFTAIGDNDDNTAELLQAVPAGCKTTNGSLPCDRHYRSRLLDQNPFRFKTIRVGVYKDGREQAFFEFKATGADYMNWFRRERILTSSYTDITHNIPANAGNIFSIEGHGGTIRRRFFINNKYDGCASDAGWLVVEDPGGHVCPWDRQKDNSSPLVLYMAGTSYGTWISAGRTVADTLVISGRMDTSSPASREN